MRRVGRFLALPVVDQWRILQLLPQVAFVRLALWLVPFSTLSRWAARPVRRTSSRQPAVEWARLVRQASSVVPYASCLTQALVLQRVLHRRGYSCTIQLGVRQDGEAGFAAHAWVEHAGEVLIGGPDTRPYAVLTSVPAAPRS